MTEKKRTARRPRRSIVGQIKKDVRVVIDKDL